MCANYPKPGNHPLNKIFPKIYPACLIRKVPDRRLTVTLKATLMRAPFSKYYNYFSIFS